MCGIIGILAQSPVNQAIYDGLTVLQHRGQDAAGIITSDKTNDGQRVYLRKDNGLVRDVFHERHMIGLRGNMGIGHVRYPTAGCDSPAEAQPFYVNSPHGLALAHNGNLTNADQLKDQLFREDLRHLNTQSDSEILLNVLAHELEAVGGLRLTPDDIFRAVSMVHRRCRGGYAVVAMIVGFGILAFRDPFGIRPIVYGRRETLFIDVNGEVHTHRCAKKTLHAPCLFEYVYLARPDSMLDGIAVHKTRLRMGERLASKIVREWSGGDIDVVIPIPDTSRQAALQVAHKLNLKYREGFIKNRYIPRTFIMPGQAERKRSVRQKLNAIDLEFRGKNVLLVDDSIVRGTTSQQIVQMAREAGAHKVYFASAAPPVRYPNVYGIDMPSATELVANGREVDEIAAITGADRLIYQDLQDLIEAAREGNPKITRFEASVFDGIYITGDVDQDYLGRIEQMRADGAKQKIAINDLGSTELQTYSL
jgi:amidophosphoribosyltransferase